MSQYKRTERCITPAFNAHAWTDNSRKALQPKEMDLHSVEDPHTRKYFVGQLRVMDKGFRLGNKICKGALMFSILLNSLQPLTISTIKSVTAVYYS